VPGIRGRDEVHRGALRAVFAIVQWTATRFSRSALGAHSHAGR